MISHCLEPLQGDIATLVGKHDGELVECLARVPNYFCAKDRPSFLLGVLYRICLDLVISLSSNHVVAFSKT